MAAPTLTLDEISALPKGARLMGLDLGTKTIGLSRVKVIHMNDSKKDLGSRVDRHDHIGRGKIGLDGFKPWVRDQAWENVPKILETPKDGKAEDGRDWDELNLETLRGLQR